MQAPAGTIELESAVPVPIFEKAPSNCSRWIMVGLGMITSDVAALAGISVSQFVAYNPLGKDSETALWAGYWYCVAVN
jgi:hypothetical protein